MGRSMTKITFQTHEQGMACLYCGLAGLTPSTHFPLPTGLWDQPCPLCDSEAVWVTEPRAKSFDGRTFEIQDD